MTRFLDIGVEVGPLILPDRFVMDGEEGLRVDNDLVELTKRIELEDGKAHRGSINLLPTVIQEGFKSHGLSLKDFKFYLFDEPIYDPLRQVEVWGFVYDTMDITNA